jgi:hypothetical protein
VYAEINSAAAMLTDNPRILMIVKVLFLISWREEILK